MKLISSLALREIESFSSDLNYRDQLVSTQFAYLRILVLNFTKISISFTKVNITLILYWRKATLKPKLFLQSTLNSNDSKVKFIFVNWNELQTWHDNSLILWNNLSNFTLAFQTIKSVDKCCTWYLDIFVIFLHDQEQMLPRKMIATILLRKSEINKTVA